MALPIEDFSTQRDDILKHLNPGSLLYGELNAKFGRFMSYAGAPHRFQELCELYALINSERCVAYFSRIKKRTLLEELNRTLLTLMRDFISQDYGLRPPPMPKPEKSRGSFFQIGLFLIITLLGTFIAAVDSASIMQSVLSIVTKITHLSNLILIPIQVAFAVLSVLTFYALELDNVAKAVGIRIFDVSVTFKLYADQGQFIQQSFELIESAMTNPNMTQQEFTALKNKYQRLCSVYDNFQSKVNQAKEARENPSTFKKVTGTIALGFAAIVCGTLGALGAQACLPTFLPLIIGAAAATGPLGLGITLGVMAVCFIAAAALYVCIGKKQIDKFINRCWGTPARAIEELTEKDTAITRIKGNVLGSIQGKERLFEREEEVRHLRHRAGLEPSEPRAVNFNNPERRAAAASSANRYNTDFHRRSPRQPDSSRQEFPTEPIALAIG